MRHSTVLSECFAQAAEGKVLEDAGARRQKKSSNRSRTKRRP